jgi:hypothetical protein
MPLIFSAVFHPKKTQLAAAGGDGEIFVIDSTDGHVVASFTENDPPQYRASIPLLSFSPDGSLLAAAWENYVKVRPNLWDQVDPKHQLREVTPDDAVVLYVASHGYADPQGTFYLMPHDTGSNWGITEDTLTRCQTSPNESTPCNQARDLLAHSISSADLTSWWSGVDAGDLVMILDSCHSGAIPGKEFRPGPLGDPGFGQLSYDKGMQILSASQPVQTARGEFVTGGEGRTLLVDALETVAKENPQQSLAQWLHGIEEQLPRTAKRLYPRLKEEDAQLPVLLDFTQKPNTTLAASQ